MRKRTGGADKIKFRATLPGVDMIDPDNLWYKGLTRQLGLKRPTFQISRPSAPMDALDASLWDCLDAVPPASLIFDKSRGKLSRFSSQYALILNNYREKRSFETAIGAETYRKWSEFLNGQTPQDTNGLPGLFLKWALPRSPGYAVAGASALAADLLASAVAHRADPPHSPAAEPPRTFEGGYGEMRELLSSSMARRLTFDMSQTGRDSGDTLAASVGGRFPGLWRGAAPDSRLSSVLTESGITVELTLGGYAEWVSKPGCWYDANALRAAFRDRAWVSWEAFFGPNGSFPRVIASLVVADEISATITSDAVLAGEERAELESNAFRGVWPFYAPDSGCTTNSVTFGPAAGIEIRTVTKRGNPAVIGNNVVSIAPYLAGTDADSRG